MGLRQLLYLASSGLGLLCWIGCVDRSETHHSAISKLLSLECVAHASLLLGAASLPVHLITKPAQQSGGDLSGMGKTGRTGKVWSSQKVIKIFPVS